VVGQAGVRKQNKSSVIIKAGKIFLPCFFIEDKFDANQQSYF
jgi:hypothetical protein